MKLEANNLKVCIRWKDYVNDGGLIYKTRDIASSYNKKVNGHFRRQIISFSQKRATKDKTRHFNSKFH